MLVDAPLHQKPSSTASTLLLRFLYQVKGKKGGSRPPGQPSRLHWLPATRARRHPRCSGLKRRREATSSATTKGSFIIELYGAGDARANGIYRPGDPDRRPDDSRLRGGFGQTTAAPSRLGSSGPMPLQTPDRVVGVFTPRTAARSCSATRVKSPETLTPAANRLARPCSRARGAPRADGCAPEAPPPTFARSAPPWAAAPRDARTSFGGGLRPSVGRRRGARMVKAERAPGSALARRRPPPRRPRRPSDARRPPSPADAALAHLCRMLEKIGGVAAEREALRYSEEAASLHGPPFPRRPRARLLASAQRAAARAGRWRSSRARDAFRRWPRGRTARARQLGDRAPRTRRPFRRPAGSARWPERRSLGASRWGFGRRRFVTLWRRGAAARQPRPPAVVASGSGRRAASGAARRGRGRGARARLRDRLGRGDAPRRAGPVSVRPRTRRAPRRRRVDHRRALRRGDRLGAGGARACASDGQTDRARCRSDRPRRWASRRAAI